MSYDQFWNDDPALAKYYREANNLKNERNNQNMWLQGMYIYDAVSTIVYNTWCRKEGQQPVKYAEKPYSFDIQKTREEKEIEASAQAEVWMHNFVNMFK